MATKDNFSARSHDYARFRPGYPDELFQFLFKHCHKFDRAWDCGTGNGQIAVQLAKRFQQVEATDISENQLKNATPHPHVRYTVQAAESPNIGLGPYFGVDLIVVGQAAHWFALNRFYEQAKAVANQHCLLALVGYTLVSTNNPAVDALVQHLYTTVLGEYWDPERQWVDNEYKNLPFPFEEIPFPRMTMEYEWSSDQLIGFLGTWSATQHYIKKNGETPISDAFQQQLKELWPDRELRKVSFPIFGRVTVLTNPVSNISTHTP